MLIAGEGCEACVCVWRRPTAGKWRGAKGKGQTERERDTSCEDFFFCLSLSLSIAPPQHREDGKKKAKWEEGWRECCLYAGKRLYWVKSMPTGRVGDNKRQKRKERWREEWEAEEEGGTLESCKKLQERSRERNERWNSYFQMQFPSSFRWVAPLIMEEPACHGGFTDFTVCQ